MTLLRVALLLVIVLPGADSQDALFRTDVRLVEVHASVLDRNGRYVDGLTQDRFRVSDNGSPQQLAAFESDSSGVSCAILLDTTGSMQTTLPQVKNSVVRLMDELREGDSVAVFGFNTSLRTLQDFTTDKESAKRNVLRMRVGGQTALFDAIAEVARAVSARKGKKVIIAFTDGGDNASVLHVSSALSRAKKEGVPVYTIAEGDGLNSAQLMKLLKEIADVTGGRSYRARKSEISRVFSDITSDLQHTYLLAYKPPRIEKTGWRTIEVAIDGHSDYRVRGRQSYLGE